MVLLGLTLAGCAVGPNYSREPAPTPVEYKELKGWKLARPSDNLSRGDWWKVYHDRGLNELLPQVEISNQTVAASAAAYEEAKAVIREAQAALFPTATAAYGVTRTRTGALAGTTGGSAVGVALTTRYTTLYSAPITGTWDLDVWGKLRRQLESNTAAAQASAADLDNAKLSAQATLAIAYFNLRATDSLIALLARTVGEYKKTLDIVQNQFNAGYSVTAGDVATAKAQLEAAQAQLVNIRVARAQYEHAIAILIGRPPSELSIAPHLLAGRIPRIPVSVPSTLLERRPDIAAAERTMQEQNALIGVAEAAYFPDVSLSSMIQYLGPIPTPFSAARSIGSIGATGTQTLFNGGLTSAQVDAARAAYWQSVANYRQTVLTAFQQVEDELAAIHYYAGALGRQHQAVTDERTAVNVYLNQFQAGTVAFTTVVTAEITLLADEESELTYQQNLFLASVSLIEALGGGWDMTLVPDQLQLQKDFSFTPQLESTPPLAVELMPTLPTPSNPPAAPVAPPH
ncbi:MAG TPA: efflux transporter outer membrane subunit [Xanthobacteraceae bacterium]|nr:efflux transporter outer membrane subunit [Xanthobacteraceae bacterium]